MFEICSFFLNNPVLLIVELTGPYMKTVTISSVFVYNL